MRKWGGSAERLDIRCSKMLLFYSRTKLDQLTKDVCCMCSKPQLLQGVYGMGFNRPSKIQETALPMMLAEP